MLVKKITLNNFRQFKGIQSLYFNANNDKNTTIIIADNGVGKTTFLQAFIFCLYGLGSVNLPSAKNLLNFDVEESLGEGAYGDVWVEIEFIHNRINYKVRRSARYQKINNRTKLVGAIRFNGTIRTHVSTEISEHNVKSIIPEQLSSFFFFDGERMQELADYKSKKELTQAVTDIMGIEYIRKALEHIGHKPTQKNALGLFNGMKKDLSPSESNDYQLIRKNTIHIENLEEINKELSQQIIDLNDKNQKISKSLSELPESSSLEKDRNICYNSIKALEKDIGNKQKELFSTFIKKLPGYILNQRKDEIDEYMNSLKKKSKNVHGIQQIAIDEIIRNGKCICGCSITKDSQEYQELMELREYLPPYDMTNLVESYQDSLNKWTSDSKNLNDEMVNINDVVDSLTHEITENKVSLDSLEASLREIDVEEIKRLEDDRLENTKQIGKLEERKTNNLKEISKAKRLIEAKESKMRKYEGANDHNRKIDEIMDILRIVYTKMNKQYENKVAHSKAILDQNIKKSFMLLFNGEYQISIGDDYSFDVYNNNGRKITEELSEGQKVVTSFAFVSGLIQSSKSNEIVKDEYLSNIDIENEDLMPLIMDAPFSKLDDTHRGNVANYLPNMADQVILFTVDNQWDGIVKQNIEKHVESVWEMEKIENSNSVEIMRVES